MKNICILIALCLPGLVSAQQSLNVSFKHVDKTVFATFSKPSGEGPFQTIILVPGSGSMDRDGTMTLSGGNVACLYPGLLNQTLKSYKQLGDALNEAGYAVLRYDKIEYTYASNPGQITFTKLWLPVESGIKYVKTRTDVDTNSLILIGHSEGSSIIPYVAKKRSDIKALISIGGPSTPIDSMLAFQIVDFTQKCGGNVPQAQAQANYILSYFDTIRQKTWTASTQPMLGVKPEVWSDYFQALEPVAQNYNQANLKTLFIGMDKDINVPPSELARLQNEVTVTADFWSLPDLNHYMTPNDDPNLSAVVPDTIVYWLRSIGLATGIRQIATESKELKLFPVPATEEITVTLDKQWNEMSYVVRNATGSEVLSGNLTQEDNKIGLEELPSGIYLLEGQHNGSRLSAKIVRQ